MIVGSSFLIYWILAVEVSVIQVPLEVAINVLDISCISAMYMYELNVVSHRKVALLRHHKSVGCGLRVSLAQFLSCLYLACTMI